MVSPLRVAVISAPVVPKIVTSSREADDRPFSTVTVAGTTALVVFADGDCEQADAAPPEPRL
jgi:hypothetical protein